ncbi:MAG: heterodisulfide reductase-related iron-sulfur binding cluster [Pseudomonadota bacterium]
MSQENNENTRPNEEKDEPTDTDEVRRLPLRSLNIKQLIALDACTRCGECLTWCPVHDQDAREAIIPRRKVIDFLKIAKAQHGFLAKIMTHEKISEPFKRMLGRIFGYRAIGKAEIEDFVQNLYECSTCGQCEVVCPAHIETVALWEELRRIIVQAGYGPLEVQKGLVKSVKAFDNPWQQPRAGRTKWARKALKDGLIRQLPREIKKTRAKVLLFFGCTASYDVNVRQVAINTINILEALGIDYGILGAEEKCCASVLLRMGDPEHHRVFKENIDLFNSLGIDTLISSCSGCFKTIMQDYPRIAPLNFEVLHSVEFFARLLINGKLTFPHPVNRTVTYHDPCHLGRATGGFDAPRMIMEAIPGLTLIEMPRNREYSRCCGAGGGLKAGFPDIQNKMARRRIREAEETGADSLVSCCPFCFQGLNIGISALESPLVMRDISALVAESLLGYDAFQQPAAPATSVTPTFPETDETGEETESPVTPEKTVSVAVAVQKNEAPSDERAAKKAERERKRMARRTEASSEVPEEKAVPPIDVIPAEVIASQPAAEKGDEEAARDAKKADREQRRAARRPVGKSDAGSGAAAESVPVAEVDAPEASPAAVFQALELPPEVAEENENDSKQERERKRAERRAEREKEKSARRDARK